MTLNIELEVEVTDDCTFDEAEEFFRNLLLGTPCDPDNPLLDDDSDAGYCITSLEVDEI